MANKLNFNQAWIQTESLYKEGKDTKTGKKKYFIEGLALPFKKISRNGVLYNEDSVRKTCEQLVGCSFMHNHVLEGHDVFPRGEVVDAYCKEDGLYYRAEIYDVGYNKDYIELMKAGGFKKVSIQISGEAESVETDDGQSYFEAVVNDWIELSSVNAPGFKQTSIQQALAEALKVSKKEDVSIGNNGADITADKLPEEEDDDTKKEQFFENLLTVRNKN